MEQQRKMMVVYTSLVTFKPGEPMQQEKGHSKVFVYWFIYETLHKKSNVVGGVYFNLQIFDTVIYSRVPLRPGPALLVKHSPAQFVKHDPTLIVQHGLALFVQNGPAQFTQCTLWPGPDRTTWPGPVCTECHCPVCSKWPGSVCTMWPGLPVQCGPACLYNGPVYKMWRPCLYIVTWPWSYNIGRISKDVLNNEDFKIRFACMIAYLSNQIKIK